MDLWTHDSHLKIALAYSWKLRRELVRLEDGDCFSTAGAKECWFCPNEFGQGTPDHRSEPVFLFQLFMGTSPPCSCSGVCLLALCRGCYDGWAINWLIHLSPPPWEPSEGSLLSSLTPLPELPRGLAVHADTAVKYMCVVSTQHSKENITFALEELTLEGRRETHKDCKAVHSELWWGQAVRWCWNPVLGVELRK